jgi:predicted nucleic acid-binding protein
MRIASTSSTLKEAMIRLSTRIYPVSAVRAVASLKAEHPIALADCFAIALAEEDEAVLMTGDPEIVDRIRGFPCEVKDLR